MKGKVKVKSNWKLEQRWFSVSRHNFSAFLYITLATIHIQFSYITYNSYKFPMNSKCHRIQSNNTKWYTFNS